MTCVKKTEITFSSRIKFLWRENNTNHVIFQRETHARKKHMYYIHISLSRLTVTDGYTTRGD